jgi:hypothetical protein
MIELLPKVAGLSKHSHPGGPASGDLDTPDHPDRFVVEFSVGGREWTATLDEDELDCL